MIIISHRGYWRKACEKNTEKAFRRSFALSFGTETDVRDSMGKIVISHDIPNGSEMDLDVFLSIADKNNLLLAINVKADGLADLLNQKMKKNGHENWFVFDMSIPDMYEHLKVGNPVFARMSDVEREPVWFSNSSVNGIWLDSFENEWFDLDLIQTLFEQGKRVCVVSSELHGRDYASLWHMLLPLAKDDRLILCTDLPEQAHKYFTVSIE